MACDAQAPASCLSSTSLRQSNSVIRVLAHKSHHAQLRWQLLRSPDQIDLFCAIVWGKEVCQVCIEDIYGLNAEIDMASLSGSELGLEAGISHN